MIQSGEKNFQQLHHFGSNLIRETDNRRDALSRFDDKMISRTGGR